MHHPETLGVHAGREDFAALGVHAPPLDFSTTYPVHDLEEGTASFDALVGGAGSARNPIYARLHNPTVARFEQALAQLEGTSDAVAFGSGMAALSALPAGRRPAWQACGGGAPDVRHQRPPARFGPAGHPGCAGSSAG